MAKAASLKTKVSTKGQVILPKAIRDRRGWTAGAELIVEDRPEGVLLREAPRVEATKAEDVRGCLGPVNRVVSIEEMHQALLDEAARRYRRAVDDRD
jgi:AbrB family looped-hinge helix DNA binding protein